MSCDLDKALKSWVQQSIGNKKCSIFIENTTQKGEGYVGEFFFVKVELQEPVDKDNILYLAVKIYNQGPEAQNKFPILHAVCKREVFFYSTIVPEYQKFQKSKNVIEPFTMMPKCYKTFSDNSTEVIVLENLKKKGYVLFPRDHTMNSPHIKICLKAYAKLHALAFAMKDQNKEKFESITKDCSVLIKQAMSQFKPLYDCKTPAIVNALKEANRHDLSTKYEAYITEKSIIDRFSELCDIVTEEKVIVHADCHNANMLFQYKDNDTNTPHHVALIDFQAVCLHSPIVDVSLFLYLNLSKEGFQEFKTFVEYYYNELSSFITALGSDANKLFPRHIMVEHLKQFVHYGFLHALPFIEILYIPNDETPPLIDSESNEFMAGLKNVQLKSREPYLERIVSMVENVFACEYK